MNGTRIEALHATRIASFTSSGQFAITRTYTDTGHGSFAMVGVPEGGRAVDLPLLQGKWLTPGKDDEAVLNHMALAQKPGLKPGNDVLLSIEGVATKWRVAGIVEDIGLQATAYVSMAGFARVAGSIGDGLCKIKPRGAFYENLGGGREYAGAFPSWDQC
jgi:hypothetical protein